MYLVVLVVSDLDRVDVVESISILFYGILIVTF